MRIGLIGLGGIGGEIVRLAASVHTEVVIIGALVRKLNDRPATRCVTSVGALIALEPDVVIECAGRDALSMHGVSILEAGIDLVPSSVGLFADENEYARFRAAAAKAGSTIRISNGAIAGIDALAAAKHFGLEKVLLRSVMPFAAEEGGIIGERVLYSGPARGAALNYPRHANLAATVSLVGIGFDRTDVVLVADSHCKVNRHEIHVSGAFGSYSVVVQGVRIRDGSPSSRLTAGSLFTAVRGLTLGS